MEKKLLKHQQEKIIDTFDYNGLKIDVADWTETIWCGKIGYAVNNTVEPDVDEIMTNYKRLSRSKANGKHNPVRDACISVNYLSPDRPNGVMFGEMVRTTEQPEGFDVLVFPSAKYMRILLNPETANALGKEPWLGGIPPYKWMYDLLAPHFGFKPGANMLPIIEYYGHYAPGKPKSYENKLCYMYVPVEAVKSK